MTSEPMISSLGGINASEDADSLPTDAAKHKSEGAYYVWTMDELMEILTEQEARICAKYWNVKPGGNVDRRADIQGELRGQNTLCVSYDLAKLAEEEKLSEEKVEETLKDGRRKLLAYREKNRPRPALDDKIVTSWNGLAIGGLARAGAALKTPAYTTAAEKAVECIRTNLYDESSNTLRRVYREGPGDTPGFADDYAFLISGLLDLYETSFNDKYLSFADNLQQTQLNLFWDDQKHAFFSTPANQADILIRTKDGMDNAEPSTNGVSANNLFRLGSLLNDEKYEKLARQTVAAFEVEIGQHPGLFSGMMSSVVAAKIGMTGIMVVGDGGEAEKCMEKYHQRITPNCTILRVGAEGVSDGWLRGRNELLKDLPEGKQMVQICEGGVCRIVGGEDIDALWR